MMGGGHQVQLLACQPFDASISGMGLDGELSLGQPMAQGFAINGKQTTTVAQRNEGHGPTPARVAANKDDNRPANCRAFSAEISGEGSWEFS
jgi:hypothetical protein